MAPPSDSGVAAPAHTRCLVPLFALETALARVRAAEDAERRFRWTSPGLRPASHRGIPELW